MSKNEFNENLLDNVANDTIKSRFKRTNLIIIILAFLYCIYRIYHVVFIDGKIYGFEFYTVIISGAAFILPVLAMQYLGLFVKWQPLIISMLLFSTETIGAMIDGEHDLYFNVLILLSMASAFYLEPKSYLAYFVSSGVILMFLYLTGILQFSEDSAINPDAPKLLAWVFYEVTTLGIFLLVKLVVQSISNIEKRDKQSLDLLAHAAELRDDDTGLHLLRTTYYAAIIIGDLMKNPHKNYLLAEKEGKYIVDTVKLHDIGKIGIDDAILRKTGSLTKEEFDIIKTHTQCGAKMFEDVIGTTDVRDALLSTAYNIAYGHHEKWDGSGYPRGLSGFDIPLCARIATVADVFDALTTERPYKKAFSARKAFDILYEEAGSHFDPYLIEIVKRHEEDFIRNLENLGDG